MHVYPNKPKASAMLITFQSVSNPGIYQTDPPTK